MFRRTAHGVCLLLWVCWLRVAFLLSLFTLLFCPVKMINKESRKAGRKKEEGRRNSNVRFSAILSEDRALTKGTTESYVESVVRANCSRQSGCCVMATADKLNAAMREHGAGQLRAAEAAYRDILKSDPQHADALHLLGVVLSQTSRTEEAILLIRRAISVNPDFAAFHANLGNALRAVGRLEEAVVSYRRALHLQPDYAEAYSNLGITLRDHNKLDEAVACCRTALQLDPDFSLAHNNLGVVLRDQGKLTDAVESFNRALQLQPDFAEAYNNLGSTQKDLGQLEEAIVSFRKSLQFKPRQISAHTNLGSALRDRDRLNEAIQSYQTALEIDPSSVQTLNNLGNALRDLGKLDLALGSFDRAISIRPEYAEAHNNRAMLRLLHGDFANGWPEYEWRSKLKTIQFRSFSQPRWDGSAVPGDTVLLHAEQGLGDTLQFVRFAPMVRSRAGRVVLLCQKPLRSLLAPVRGVDLLVTDEGELPAIDVQLPLLSVPGVLNTRMDTIPSSVPYIWPDEELVRRWQAKLAEFPGFRVGISWQGNPDYPLDRLRSVPLRHYLPLSEVPGVRLVCVQKAHGLQQLERVRGQFEVVELGDDFDETSGPFMDSAAVMKSLDLLITSDTATAHLAGALGIPVWVALPRIPDWRWLLERTDSPWYPTMRLFRQQRRGEWDEVFQRIRHALVELVRNEAFGKA